MEDNSGPEKGETSFDKTLDDSIKATEEILKNARKQADEALKDASEHVTKTFASLEEDLTELGRKATEYGSRNPLMVGAGLIAVAGLLVLSLLQSASSNRK